MSEPNLDYVRKGISEPREGLRDQGVVSAALGLKYETELAGGGRPKENTQEIATLTEIPGSQIAAQAEAKITSKGATATEGATQSFAKEVVGKIRLGSSIVLSKTTIPNVTKETFHSGGTLGRSTPKIFNRRSSPRKFNKDILNRARKSQKKSSVESA